MSADANGRLFDPGLQPERTELAWRRTVLALCVGALVSVRILPLVLGLWALVLSVLGVVAAVTLWVLAHRRTGQIQRALRDPALFLPDGTTLLLLATTVAVGALLGLLYVALK